MAAEAFEKQVLDTLFHLNQGIVTVKQELDLIREIIVDDSILSDEDKEAIELALQEEKEGKLLSKEQVFG